MQISIKLINCATFKLLKTQAFIRSGSRVYLIKPYPKTYEYKKFKLPIFTFSFFQKAKIIKNSNRFNTDSYKNNG